MSHQWCTSHTIGTICPNSILLSVNIVKNDFFNTIKLRIYEIKDCGRKEALLKNKRFRYVTSLQNNKLVKYDCIID